MVERKASSGKGSAGRRDRRADLQARYGVEFPDDLFAVWELARSIKPRDPRSAFWVEPFNVALNGPFDVLAGAFDRAKPAHSTILHYRYVFDPPELFTIACGDTDGLHWGYWFDDGKTATWVASYSTNDAYEVVPCGRTFVEALRMHLELCWAGTEENIEDDPEEEAAYRKELDVLAKLRSRLVTIGTEDRKEIGARYERKYGCKKARAKQAVAPTKDGMGIVAPKKTWRPVSAADADLDSAIRAKRSRAALVREAEGALASGFPATALKIAKELWVRGTKASPEVEQASYPLLIAAYEALDRPALAEVVRVHARDRWLPWVDLLQAQEG